MFVALGGLLLQGMLQGVIAPQRKHLLPPPFKLSGMYGKNMNRNRTMELAFGPLFLASTGFREVVASWLWIRANDMFHSGDYEGLVPLVRTVVLLDPHQIDVYATGAVHSSSCSTLQAGCVGGVLGFKSSGTVSRSRTW